MILNRLKKANMQSWARWLPRCRPSANAQALALMRCRSPVTKQSRGQKRNYESREEKGDGAERHGAEKGEEYI